MHIAKMTLSGGAVHLKAFLPITPTLEVSLAQ